MAARSRHFLYGPEGGDQADLALRRARAATPPKAPIISQAAAGSGTVLGEGGW